MKIKKYKKVWTAWVEGDFAGSAVFDSKVEAQQAAEGMARTEALLAVEKPSSIRTVYFMESIAVFVAPIPRPVLPVRRVDL